LLSVDFFFIHYSSTTNQEPPRHGKGRRVVRTLYFTPLGVPYGSYLLGDTERELFDPGVQRLSLKKSEPLPLAASSCGPILWSDMSDCSLKKSAMCTWLVKVGAGDGKG
jgi:hypothetical protein